MKVYRKTANDMFFAQGSWAFGFLSVVFIIHIVKMVVSYFTGSEINPYYVTTFIASNIFMLVIGIISPIGFIPYFVSLGVTRKDYFKGGVLGSAGVALAIPIVSVIISLLFGLFEKLLKLSVSMGPFAERDPAEEGNFVGDLVQSIIFTPFVDLSENWLLALFVFALNIFTYYVAGWFIGAAFGRLGIFGILSIPFALILIFAEDLLLSLGLGLPVPSIATSIEMPLILSLLVIAFILAVFCWAIRQLTKKMVVKI